MNNFYEHIEDYLLGNLALQDKKSFENELLKDKNLQQEVDNQRFVIESLQQSALREKVKANLVEAKKETSVRSIAPMQWQKAAAMIGVIVSVGVAYWVTRPTEKQADIVVVQPNTPSKIDTPAQPTKIIETPKEKDWLKPETSPKKKEQLADVTIKKNPLEMPESGVRDIQNTEKSKGLTLAERFFENSSNNIANEDLKTGIQFFKEKKYEAASKSLLKIEEESPVYGESQWYLALSLLARDRYQTAMNILDDISKDEKNPHQAKAKELWSELLE